MTIKSLLLGSAAALAVVSGAQAADAIVAAEPEAVEYVRVCDAYGTGYFYIPGTETCLKIEGYVRFDVNFGFGDFYDNGGLEDWSSLTRGQVQFTAKSDTEYGPLTGVIVYQANYRPNGDASNNTATDGTDFALDTAYIDIAGLRVGKLFNWWDDDFSGEFDVTNSGNTSSTRSVISMSLATSTLVSLLKRSVASTTASPARLPQASTRHSWRPILALRMKTLRRLLLPSAVLKNTATTSVSTPLSVALLVASPGS